MYHFAAMQGWNEHSQLTLTLQYLTKCRKEKVIPSGDAFSAFLSAQAEDENIDDFMGLK